MSKYKFILFLTILFSNGFLHGQTLSYYDLSSGKIKYIEGLTGKKNKIINGKKEGNFEQVVIKKEIQYFDDYNFIPNIEKSFADTNLSVKKLINSGNGNFFVFVGNYVDGLKQGEFKLQNIYKNYGSYEIQELASINYINDTIEGSLKFNDQYFNQEHKDYGIVLVSVLMTKNKVINQTINTTKKGDYIVLKDNKIDSGYHISHDYWPQFYFKKSNSTGEFYLTFLSENEKYKTILRVFDGDHFIRRGYYLDFRKNIENVNCVGLCIKPGRYITFKMIDGKFTGFVNCYYLNDSLNYSINTETGQIDIWTDLSIDENIQLPNFGSYLSKTYRLNLIAEDEFLTDIQSLKLPQYQSGYFKLACIKNVRFTKKNGSGYDPSLSWFDSKPFSIDYRIDNHIIRNETWQEDILGHFEKQFTNYDINGNVLNSSLIEKKQKYIKNKENEQLMRDAFGVKDDNAVVKCSYCKKSLVKKNGITIRTSKCQSSDILCLDNLGNSCEWTFCSMSCSNNFQCVTCSDKKLYRANCR